jgi:hypothetical protein
MSIVFPNFVNPKFLQKIGRGDLTALTQSIAELDERTIKAHRNTPQLPDRPETDKSAGSVTPQTSIPAPK